ncbi:hypothetical protein [Clostridium sp.]|uniref:hypothetical protein n=1 Tax=Clostridium sp. TaxID=1506 RepID=UPI0032171F4A
MKYWEYTDEELLKQKMYPLIPLQLFSLRKELELSSKNNNINKMKELSYRAKELATKLANESKDLFKSDEILGEDFHKMLLAIQNLIEYLNRNYLNDDILEKEVNTMTKTLYDPEVEKKGVEKGIEKGIEKGKLEAAKSLLDILEDKVIADKLNLKLEVVKALREEKKHEC